MFPKMDGPDVKAPNNGFDSGLVYCLLSVLLPNRPPLDGVTVTFPNIETGFDYLDLSSGSFFSPIPANNPPPNAGCLDYALFYGYFFVSF